MKPIQQFKFRLYTAGDTRNSVLAISNLKSFCALHLANRYEIEFVDVFKEPSQALAAGIFMTPTLVRLLPLPLTRIVGVLSDSNSLNGLLALEVLTP
jgi:circadian clock protein KaiB